MKKANSALIQLLNHQFIPYLCGANTYPYNISPAEPTYPEEGRLKAPFYQKALIISEHLDKE